MNLPKYGRLGGNGSRYGNKPDPEKEFYSPGGGVR